MALWEGWGEYGVGWVCEVGELSLDLSRLVLERKKVGGLLLIRGVPWWNRPSMVVSRFLYSKRSRVPHAVVSHS